MPEFAGPRSLRQLLEALLTLGSDLELAAVLRRIVESAVGLVDARFGALGVLDETRTGLAEFITVGVDDDTHRSIGHLPEGHGILGLLILDPRPLRLPDLHEHPDSYGFPPNHPEVRSFLGAPVRIRNEVFGNLYLTDKTTADAFTDVDEELVVALAAAAGVAIDNARLHARVRDLALLEDRERIARDLHDTVIQRLFATGLALQRTARLAHDPDVGARIEAAVDDLDLTVKHVRSAIFGLEASRPWRGQLRERVLSLTRQSAGPLGFEPHVLFDGPVEAAILDAMASDLLATLGEALANVARHARATRVDVVVAVNGEVALRVLDNGAGLACGRPSGSEGHGLANMARRAEGHGGKLDLRPGEEGGTVVEWRVPRA